MFKAVSMVVSLVVVVFIRAFFSGARGKLIPIPIAHKKLLTDQ